MDNEIRITTLEEALEYIKILIKENLELKKRVEDLENQLKKNSKNSSKPPSSDFKSDSSKGKNNGGAKPGHKGCWRQPFSSSQVTKKINVLPDICPRCGSKELVSERKPWFHQVMDLPKININITEYRLERCRCDKCGKHVRASLPEGVVESNIGPRLTAFIGDASCRLSLPLRKVVILVHALTGQKLSPGTIWKCQQRISAALEKPYKEARKDFRNERAVGADETSWRTCGQKRWVWLGSGEKTTILFIGTRRNREHAERLLGKDSRQPLTTDRYQAYAPKGPHQYCLAHWKRDIEGFKTIKGAEKFYEEVVFDLKEVFDSWSSYQEGLIDEKQFRGRTYYRRRRIEGALTHWATAGPTDKFRSFCERCLKKFDKFWTYTRISGMEPTNNRSERDLRQIVIRRKICFGTRSEEGETFIARVYTVMQTCAKRGIDFLSYLQDVLKCFWSEKTLPKIAPLICV